MESYQYFQDRHARKFWLFCLGKVARTLLLAVVILEGALNKMVIDNSFALPQTETGDTHNWEILFKGGTSLKLEPHLSLTRWVGAWSEQDGNGAIVNVIFDKDDLSNYCINSWTIIDTERSSQNTILDCQFKLTRMVLFDCLFKLTLRYPLSEPDPESGVRKFKESDVEREKNTELCFSILENVYVAFYEKVAETYLGQEFKPVSKPILKSILTKVENSIALIAVISPIIIQYIENLDNLKTRLAGSPKVKEVMKQTELRVLKRIIDFLESDEFKEVLKKTELRVMEKIIDFLKSIKDKYYVDQFQELEPRCIKSKCLRLLDEFNVIFTPISTNYNSSAEPRTETLDDSFIDKCTILKGKFDSLYGETNSLFRVEVEALECIKLCSSFLDWFLSAHRDLLTYKEDDKSNFCCDEFSKAFVRVDAEMYQVEWIGSFISDIYIWQIAFLAETNSTILNIMTNMLKEREGAGKHFNAYAKDALSLLPALVKSLCDTIQKPEDIGRSAISVDDAIKQLVSQEFEFEFVYLMDLYWAVANEKDPKKEDFESRFSNLKKEYDRLKEKGNNSDEELVRMQYAMCTLIFSPSFYNKAKETFTTKFVIILYLFENNFDIELTDSTSQVNSNCESDLMELADTH